MKFISYTIIALLVFTLACKKKKPYVGLCDEIECKETIVNVNGSDYLFEQTIFTNSLVPDTGSLLLLKKYTISGVSVIEGYSLTIPTKLGMHKLKTTQFINFVSYSISTIDPADTFEEGDMVDSYDNWVEIKEQCKGSLRGTVHVQLSLFPLGKKSVVYKTDTLNVHFDFSVSPN
tara:strand:+ start:50749 stop:51273 length:525 start_codon:yes stop_codon:yes gene_type:complete